MKNYIKRIGFIVLLLCIPFVSFSQGGIGIGYDCGQDINGYPISSTTYFHDGDGDSYGNPNSFIEVCDNSFPPANYVLDDSDCDDSTPAFFFTLYYDADMDGYGDINNPGEFENKGCPVDTTGYVSNSDDCDDYDVQFTPLTQWFLDVNNNGVLSQDELVNPVFSCTQPIGNYIYYETVLESEYERRHNYTHTKSYDIYGNIKAENRDYFDELGRPNVSLSKDNINNIIWAKDIEYNSFGRVSKSSFVAPSPYTDFRKVRFYSADDGTSFTSSNINTYYSDSNVFEPYQATATHPYIENEYDQLNPGQVIRSYGGNQIAGAWKTGYKFTVPAAQELYYVFGYDYFNGTYNATTNKEEINTKFYKTISVDANGNENVVFTDGEGKTIASARSGITSPASITPYRVFSTIGTQGYVDVHIPAGIASSTISFLGSGVSLYRVFDLKTGTEIVPLTATSLTGGNFYRIVAVTPPTVEPKTYVTNVATGGVLSNDTNALGISYFVNYYDYSINVYDKTNRLTKTIQPNAFKAVYPTTIAIRNVPTYLTPTYVNFTTSYTYNTLGQVVQVTSIDEGTSKYAYRQDGQIRFSQNSVQALANQVAYTNYDLNARPIESGVITLPPATPIWPIASTSTNTNDATLFGGVLSERLLTIYDDPSNSSLLSFQIPSNLTLQTLAAGATQNNLSGSVAITYKVEKIGTTDVPTSITWYSYDTYGRIEYITQYMHDLGGAKTISYEYDANGNLNVVNYGGQTLSEGNVHSYMYDLDNRLIQVSTRLGGKTQPWVVEAEYSYYHTGELKRTKIAEGVQGMDYVYTLGGMLKSINHPSLEQAKDPGNDANDLFGITLDYYPGDYKRLVSGVNNFQTHTSTAPDYNGNIKGIRWANKTMDFISGSINQKAYTYDYNRNNWLKDSYFGTTNNTAQITPNANSAFKEHTIAYDANGNITTLRRNNDTGVLVDQLTYSYNAGKNQLNRVADAVTALTYPNDIDPQAANNYQYNSRGQLILNVKELTHYVYNAFGLVSEVRVGNLTFASAKTIVKFYYNERGHRIRKESFDSVSGSLLSTDYYVLDLKGNAVAIYNRIQTNPTVVALKEAPIYGLSRIGVIVKGTPNVRNYEITDHLGNVRAVVQKTVNPYPNNVTMGSYADYYPFGEPLTNRNSNAALYRYAFQGQEKDNETGMEAFQLRLWDGRIGRWLSPDPYGQYASPYLGMGNNPISGIDSDGGFWEELKNWIFGPGWISNKGLAALKAEGVTEFTSLFSKTPTDPKGFHTIAFNNPDGEGVVFRRVKNVNDLRFKDAFGFKVSVGVQGGFNLSKTFELDVKLFSIDVVEWSAYTGWSTYWDSSETSMDFLNISGAFEGVSGEFGFNMKGSKYQGLAFQDFSGHVQGGYSSLLQVGYDFNSDDPANNGWYTEHGVSAGGGCLIEVEFLCKSKLYHGSQIQPKQK